MSVEELSELLSTRCRLVGYRPAHEVVEQVDRLTYLHSGPPVDPGRPLPAPLVGGLAAGLLFEGETDEVEDALAMVRGGRVRMRSCQDANVAGPLVGIVTPHSAMVVVERADGRLFCSPMHEGDDGGMRTGMYDMPTLERLRHVTDVVAPALDQAVRETVVPVLPVELQRSALRRGDECHNRNVSATQALVFALAPAIARLPGADAAAVMDYFSVTTQHFIAISAAVAKALADLIDETSGLTGLVTAVGMNGQDFGIRVSGLDGWFTAPAPVGPMIALGGADTSTASPGQGDSPIIETMGLGAFALSSAPALGHTLGFSSQGMRDLVDEMRGICGCESPVYELPNQDFAPAPAGIDVRKVTATGIAPATTLGFLSRVLGQGRVGAGVIRMPMQPFADAREALLAAERAGPTEQEARR